MEAAAVVLLLAGVGIETGWRPMPDGSPRSELLVQVDPELLESAGAGMSIPIAADVPPEAGPVGRVRVVVGRGSLTSLPRQVRMKPPGGINLTQYVESTAPRYGTPPAGSAAASATVAAGYDPYTQVPPSAGAGTGASWNAAEASPANPLRTSGGGATGGGDASWNAGSAATEATDGSQMGPIQRIGAEVQNATAPLKEGLDRFGNRIRTAAGNVGNRTGQLLDELGRPLTGGGTTLGGGDAAATAPPYAGADVPPATEWNPAAGLDPTLPPVGGDGGGSNWNEDGAAATGGGGNAGGIAPPYDVGPTPPPLATGDPMATGTSTDVDPWANAVDPRLRTGGGSAPPTSGDATTTTTWPGVGPDRPTDGQQPGVGGGQDYPASDGTTGVIAGGATTPGTPAIGRGMLALPGDRNLEGVAPSTGPAPELVTGPNLLSATGTGTGAATTGGAPTGVGLSAATPGWGAGAVTPASTATPPASTAPSTSSARDRAAVILAWVLLFASVAGNMYLFWSYLDVRTKYRALVRKTARAVGSRFSPA